MSNKKSHKKKTPVLVGLPDAPITTDNDPYASKIGGLPVWLDHNSPPSADMCQCKICRSPMYLLFQSYAPLPDSPYHRVIYVWGCNKRLCMRKEGSFTVIRSHLVDKEYLKAQKQKEDEKKKRDEKKKKALATQAMGFQMGDVWGTNAGFGTSQSGGFGTSQSGGFGTSQSGGFGTSQSGGFGTSQSGGFGTSQSGGFGMKSNTSIQRNKVKSVEEELVKKMNVLSVVTHPVNTDTLPRFPGHYLYIDEENLNNYESMGIDLSRYKQYLDMEEQLLMELDEPEGEGWQGETYEKQNLPRGVDKQFKKFTERVECEPTQCVRYEYKGTPLLYSALTQQQQDILNSKCKYCKCPRIFELQLMPNILSLLPTTEYAMADQDKIQSNMISNSWNVGMEFGTILIFSCQKDCHPGSMEEVTYAEESCIVQYEID